VKQGEKPGQDPWAVSSPAGGGPAAPFSPKNAPPEKRPIVKSPGSGRCVRQRGIALAGDAGGGPPPVEGKVLERGGTKLCSGPISNGPKHVGQEQKTRGPLGRGDFGDGATYRAFRQWEATQDKPAPAISGKTADLCRVARCTTRKRGGRSPRAGRRSRKKLERAAGFLYLRGNFVAGSGSGGSRLKCFGLTLPKDTNTRGGKKFQWARDQPIRIRAPPRPFARRSGALNSPIWAGNFFCGQPLGWGFRSGRLSLRGGEGPRPRFRGPPPSNRLRGVRAAWKTLPFRF